MAALCAAGFRISANCLRIGGKLDVNHSPCTSRLFKATLTCAVSPIARARVPRGHSSPLAKSTLRPSTFARRSFSDSPLNPRRSSRFACSSIAFAKSITTLEKSNAGSFRCARNSDSAVATNIRTAGSSAVPCGFPDNVVPQLPLRLADAGALGVELHPESPVDQFLANVRLEVSRTIVARDDERQLDHAAVDRYGPIVVARVAQLLELFDNRDRVVGNHATDVEQLKPAVAAQTQLTIEARNVIGLAVVGLEVVATDCSDVTDVRATDSP